MSELSGDDTISEELERSCAEEQIHIIGTVQPHGFVLVVDIGTTRIVQASSGAARHWVGLGTASELLTDRIDDRVEGLFTCVGQWSRCGPPERAAESRRRQSHRK